MKDVLSSVTAGSAKYPGHIGGCLFSEFDWLSLSLSNKRFNGLESGTAKDINRILGADTLRIQIGKDSGGNGKVYILQVEENEKLRVKTDTPCEEEAYLFKYKFVKSSMPKNSEYREDNEQ